MVVVINFFFVLVLFCIMIESWELVVEIICLCSFCIVVFLLIKVCDNVLVSECCVELCLIFVSDCFSFKWCCFLCFILLSSDYCWEKILINFKKFVFLKVFMILWFLFINSKIECIWWVFIGRGWIYIELNIFMWEVNWLKVWLDC